MVDSLRLFQKKQEIIPLANKQLSQKKALRSSEKND